jgi:hypothetical protein
MAAQAQDFTFGKPGKICEVCQVKWPLEFFDLDSDQTFGRKSGCTGCRTNDRHERKYRNPWREWASRTLSKHFRQDGYASLAAGVEATGITPDQLAEVGEREFEHGKCGHCRRTWKWLAEKTGNPRGTMQLDRRDPTKPLTRSNWQLRCETGNKQKGRLPPEVADVRDRCWELYDEHDVWAKRPIQLELPGLGQDVLGGDALAGA